MKISKERKLLSDVVLSVLSDYPSVGLYTQEQCDDFDNLTSKFTNDFSTKFTQFMESNGLSILLLSYRDFTMFRNYPVIRDNILIEMGDSPEGVWVRTFFHVEYCGYNIYCYERCDIKYLCEQLEEKVFKFNIPSSKFNDGLIGIPQ